MEIGLDLKDDSNSSLSAGSLTLPAEEQEPGGHLESDESTDSEVEDKAAAAVGPATAAVLARLI